MGWVGKPGGGVGWVCKPVHHPHHPLWCSGVGEVQNSSCQRRPPKIVHISIIRHHRHHPASSGCQRHNYKSITCITSIIRTSSGCQRQNNKCITCITCIIRASSGCQRRMLLSAIAPRTAFRIELAGCNIYSAAR